MTIVRLHIPDEPVEHLAVWRQRLANGETLDDVLFGEGGIEAWYWDRWRAVERLGIQREHFSLLAGRHRREFGLWLRGERRHEAVASSFAGRVERVGPPMFVADATSSGPSRVRQDEQDRATVGATA